MVALSMIVQLFATFAPAEPTLAASGNDIIRGGFSSKQAALDKCRANEAGFATILSHFGVSCDAVAGSSTKSIRSTDYDKQLYSMGRLPYGKPGEVSVNIANAGTFYMRPLWSWDSGAYSTYTALSGTRADGTPFMILYNCGNITIVGAPAPPPPAPPRQTVPPRNVSPPPPSPQFNPGNASCVALTSELLGPRQYRFKAQTAGTDYVVKSYRFEFGDGQSTNITRSLFNASTEHTYASAGTYTATASISVDVQGESGVLARTLRCQTSITVSQPVTPQTPTPPTPPTPEPPAPPPCIYNPTLPAGSPECKPCEDSEDKNDTTACLILSKTARNDTQNIDKADGTVAKAGDVITYSLSVENTGKAPVNDFVVQENITDILDYATVTNARGATIDDNNLATWPATDIAAGQTITKQLTVTIKSPIPETPISASNPASHDLTLTNVYGRTVNIKLPPSVAKTTEQITRTMPNTGPGTSLVISFGLATMVGYFFFRSRLMAKELDLVRRDYASSGGA